LRLALGSLPRNQLILRHGDILSDTSVGSDCVVELHRAMVSLAKGQRVGVVEELHLRLARFSFVDCAYAWVLLVEP